MYQRESDRILETTKRADDEIEAATFREAWSKLQNTDEFFGLTRKFGVMRGQIGVQSEVGRGTTFTFTLPVAG